MQTSRRRLAAEQAVPAARANGSPRRGRSKKMAVILADTPPGWHWGWYSREEPRMRLQTADEEYRNQYKVWLETRGKRSFDPIGDIPSKVRKKLEAELQKRRPSVEVKWVKMMMSQGWLAMQVRPPYVVLTAYPNTPNRFERHVPFSDGMSAELAGKIGPKDVRLNYEFAVIEFFPNRPEDERPWIAIPDVLWQDR